MEDDFEPQKTPYQIALVFFGKVSAWIAIPAVLLLVAHLIMQNKPFHTVAVAITGVIAIAVSFYGIYLESKAIIDHHDI